MKNKIVRFVVITVLCLIVWIITQTVHFNNTGTREFLRGFSMGLGFFAFFMLIYNLVIPPKQRKDLPK